MSTFITELDAAGALDGTEPLIISQLSATVEIAAATLSAAASDNSFNDSGSGFVAAGFAEGDRIHVVGFTGDVANNIYVGTIETLTTGKMIIASPEGDSIVDDAAGESVTITKWESHRTTAQDIADLATAGAVEVQDEGATETAAATILNFVGAGVTVTDQGGGEAEIDIPGGAGSAPVWELVDQAGAAITKTVVTMTIASPGVVTWNSHGFAADTAIRFSTTGALPTGLTAGTTYYVRNPATNTFEVSATVGGASINTSGSQSGVHSAQLAASWTWKTNVTEVDFIGLAGSEEILVYASGVSVSVSGAAVLQVSTNNGGAWWSTSGDYLAIDVSGTVGNTIGATLWGTNSTAARYGTARITGASMTGAPRMIHTSATASTHLRPFIADNDNDIDAVRVVPSGGGNVTGGMLFVYVKR